MALQSSGSISLAQIQSEFGGSNPISLSEYYRDGSYITDNNTGVPTSDDISMSILRGTQRIVGKDVVNHIAPYAGSYVSMTPSNNTGGMYNWSATQQFTNSPTSSTGTAAFRSGDTNDSTFTARANASSLGFPSTTALAWQSSRVSAVPQDPKINGSTSVTTVNSTHYESSASSNNDKVYHHSYNLFKRDVALTSGTYASVDFQTGGSVTQSNDKGGILLLHGDWRVSQTGNSLSGSGTLNIAGNQICMLICNGSADATANLMNLGTNSNIAFLLNLKTNWYDNIQVAILGNKTESTQSISYNITGDSVGSALISPKPVFFEMD